MNLQLTPVTRYAFVDFLQSPVVGAKNSLLECNYFISAITGNIPRTIPSSTFGWALLLQEDEQDLQYSTFVSLFHCSHK